MKYKVGDKVKVREDLKLGWYGCINTTGKMCELVGKTVTIANRNHDTYNIAELFGFNWTDEMFEGLAENNKEIKMEPKFNIVSYNVYDNKTIVVRFDNVTERAVCCDEDQFDLERGVEICILKNIFGEECYKKLIKTAMKQIKAIDKAKADKEKEEEMIAAKKAKNARRKARTSENRRKRRVAEMKEAYLAAMREYGSTECIACESFLDDAK